MSKSGRPWTRYLDTHGILATPRKTEVVFTEEGGWHVHHHLAFITKARLSDRELKVCHAELAAMWAGACAEFRRKAIPRQQKMKRIEYAPRTMAEYITKPAPHSRSKTAGSASVEDLILAAAEGYQEALDLLHEYEREMAPEPGRKKRVCWSPGKKLGSLTAPRVPRFEPKE